MDDIYLLGFKPSQKPINMHLLEFSLKHMRALPFHPPAYSSLLQNAHDLAKDLAEDRIRAEIQYTRAEEQRGLGHPDGPRFFRTPLKPPEVTTGSILDTSS